MVGSQGDRGDHAALGVGVVMVACLSDPAGARGAPLGPLRAIGLRQLLRAPASGTPRLAMMRPHNVSGIIA